MRISDWSSDVCSSDLWSHRDRELFALDMLPCDQGFDHPVDRTFGAILFPFGVDRGVDQAALGIVEAVDMATHLTDDRLQHGDAIEPIIFVALRLRRVDHREGIEAETRDRKSTRLNSSH